MSNIINPYRYGAGDDPPGGDYVEISTSATVEEDMYDSDYKYFVIDSTTSSAFTVTNAGDSAGSDTIEVYLIAGGGGGGASGSSSGVGCGSGGGAGGYLRDLSFSNGGSLDQAYNVTIGGGGDGYDSGASTNGEDSQLYDNVSRSMNFADGDYLTTDSSTDFAWGTGDYTMEFWVKPDDLDIWEVLFYSSEFVLYLSAGKLRLYYNGYSSGSYIGTVACVVANEWNNVAIARESGTTRFFVNGEEQAIDNGSETDSYDWGSSAIPLQIGSYSTFDYAGLFTGIRLTKGEALYTADYTPISEAYSAGSNTKLLIQPNTDQSDFTDSSGEGHTLTATGISWSTDLSTDLPTMIGVGGGAGASYGVGAGGAGDGGSGGGGGFTYAYGDGTTGQGNDGGPLGPASPYETRYTHGGGGGAGEAGSTDAVGHGGDGVQYEWMDDSYNMLGPDGDGYFAGGGAGAQSAGSSAEGGQGGGGANGADGSSGSANSGGGGGGSNSNVANGGTGGNGGSGYLIVRWKFQN